MQLTKMFILIRNNQAGGLLPLIGLGIFMLIAAIGSAVDIGRAQIAQTRLITATDAATLAGAQMKTDDEIRAEINRYFRTNFPSGTYAAKPRPLDIRIENNLEKTIDVVVKADVPTVFMRMFGYDNMTIIAESQAKRGKIPTELVLALDITDSMLHGSGNAFSDMKKDSKQFLRNVQSDFGTDLVMIGLVPWAGTVNIHTKNAGWVNLNTGIVQGGNEEKYGPTTYGKNGHGKSWPVTWGGCVSARGNDGDLNEDTPYWERFPSFYAYPVYEKDLEIDKKGKDEYEKKGGKYVYENPDRDDWQNANFWMWDKYKKEYVKQKQDNDSNDEKYGPNRECPISSPIVPLTRNIDKLVDTINDIELQHNTLIPIGLTWAWRVLSPDWRYLWDVNDGFQVSNRPGSYIPSPASYYSGVNKVIVLMTDGKNQPSDNLWNAYGNIAAGKEKMPGNPDGDNSAMRKLDKMTTKVCTNIKAQGIKIFTIFYQTGGPDEYDHVKDMLRDCASVPWWHYHGRDLNNIYGEIEKEMRKVFLTR